MAKTEATLKLEHDIKIATLKMGTFGCLEVTIGFGGKERVDYMTYDTNGIFRCYEIKVSKSDFHSKHANSFCGHYNYYVMTKELYDQVADEIPDWVGCYVGQCCVKKPKKQDIDSKVYTFRRSVNGKSTELSIPWTDMLKDSIIRSLYRDSQKLHRSKNKNYVDATRRELDAANKEIRYQKNRYMTLYNNVRELIGRKAVRLMMDEEINWGKTPNERTNHENIILMNKHNLALFLKGWQGKDLSVSKIEEYLGELVGEQNNEKEKST